METAQVALLFFAGIGGGGLNSVVGGGTFVAFPAMLFAGVPAVSANASTTMALWPGGVSSLYAYRRDLDFPRAMLVAMMLSSVAGGVLGATLLLRTSDAAFVSAVPWLLLFGTLLFTFGGKITAAIRARSGANDPGIMAEGRQLGTGAIVVCAVMQLLIAIYGAYFGGGMGIMMLATWTALGMTNMHAMNALRTVLGSILNAVALVSFIIAGRVAWGPGGIMLVGALLGGYFGASVARRMPPARVRRLVVAIAWVMTAYFFVRAWA